MNGKEYVIKVLQSALEQKNEELKECQEMIKSMQQTITKRNSRALEVIVDICALEAAIEKLKDQNVIAGWEKTMQEFEKQRKREARE